MLRRIELFEFRPHCIQAIDQICQVRVARRIGALGHTRFANRAETSGSLLVLLAQGALHANLCPAVGDGRLSISQTVLKGREPGSESG